MGIVTFNAGFVAIDVREERVITVAIILISTLGQRAVLRGCCGKVMNIGKAKVCTDGVIVHTGCGDTLVDADL